MGIGSYTHIKFFGKKSDLEKIYAYGNDADDGELYLRVFGVDDYTCDNFTDEECYNFLEKVGVNSLTQAYCSAIFEKKGRRPYVEFDVYSTYETPIGCWEKIAEEFPEIEGVGSVIREDDYDEVAGEITIKNGEVEYVAPEEMYDEDEDESD